LSDESAEVLAERAKKQGKNAAKNSGKAAKAAAEPVVEAVAEEVRDTAEKVEGTVDDVVYAVRKDARIKVLGDVALGGLALAMSVYAGSIALGKFAYVRGYLKGVDLAVADRTQAID
jgi:uncharacterized alpha/beta hydrolase family protein